MQTIHSIKEKLDGTRTMCTLWLFSISDSIVDSRDAFLPSFTHEDEDSDGDDDDERLAN
jgi:hypothetical protein